MIKVYKNYEKHRQGRQNLNAQLAIYQIKKHNCKVTEAKFKGDVQCRFSFQKTQKMVGGYLEHAAKSGWWWRQICWRHSRAFG